MAWSSPYAYVAGQTVTAANLNTYLSANLQYLYDNRYGVGRRNAIINSHFDVWQRGTSFTVASSTLTYTADRWAVYRAATGLTVERHTGPTDQLYNMWLKRGSGTSSTATIYAYHALETVDSKKFAGHDAYLRLTLAAGANFSAASSQVLVRVMYGTGTDESPEATWTGSGTALSVNQTITTTATVYEYAAASIPSNATQVRVVVSYVPVGTAGANDWFAISAAQLSVDPAPGYERLPYAETLALCQRYFYALPQSGADGAAYSTTGCCLTCHFPVDMRTTPTSSYPAGTYGTNFWGIGNGTSTTVPTDDFIGTRKVTMAQDGYSGLTANRGASLYSHPGISFSAEL